MMLVVVGDVLLDRDVDGLVHRLCPDAPAPVLDERSTVERAGGAGLAAAFAAADGCEVALVTAVADDDAGARLCALLAKAGVQVYAVPRRGATVEKIRLRADRQTLLRLDRGGSDEPVDDPAPAALEALHRASAILVSDYGHGMARQPAVRRALAEATAPVVWDPHPRGPAAVAGSRLVTPNEAELRRLVDSGPSEAGERRFAGTARAAQALRDRWRVAAVAVTLGAEGALLCHAGPTPLVVPAPEVAGAAADPCGAGDRFAASATAALAGGALVSEAVQEAVARASAYVAGDRRTGTGTGPPGPEGRDAAAVVSQVRAAGGTVVATGGCFDLLHTGHLATLRAARALGDCLIVCLNSDRSVAGLKGADRPVTPQADRARLLAALDCVDAVAVFDEPTPEAVLSWLRPDIWVKGGDYDGDAELPEAGLIRRWGGQAVVVPYQHGRSTTASIAATRGQNLEG